MSYIKSIKGETTMQKLLKIGVAAILAMLVVAAAAALVARYTYITTDPVTGHYRKAQPVITMDTRTWLK